MSAELRKRFERKDAGVNIGGHWYRVWTLAGRAGNTPVAVMTRARSRLPSHVGAQQFVGVHADWHAEDVPLSWLRRQLGAPDWRDRTPCRPLLIGPQHFDARIIARGLAVVPSCKTVRVEVELTSSRPAATADTLRIVAPRWLVLVAHIRESGPALVFPRRTS